MATVSIRKRHRLNVWRDVIFALFTREIRTGFNDKFGLSWAIINPVAFIVILSFIREFINGPYTHTIPTFVFMAVGILYIQSFLKVMQSCATSIKRNKALYAFRQVQPVSAVIAAAIFEFLVKIFSTLSILLILYFLDINIQLDNGLLFLGCFVTLLVLGCALGLMFGIAELYISEIGKVRELASRPLFFISGSFFSLQDIPREFWHYLDWNPILHAIEMTRFALMSSYGGDGASFSYLIGMTLGVCFFSLAVYFVSWKQAISR